MPLCLSPITIKVSPSWMSNISLASLGMVIWPLGPTFTLTMKQTRFPYRGGARIVPKFTLKYKKTTLVEGRDFKFWTTNAKAVGTATLSIRGLGRFQGTCCVPYTIIRRAAKYLSAKVSSPTFKATGKPITPKVAITYRVENGDTTFYDTIDPVWIFGHGKRSDKDWRKYYKLVYNFAKVYPYAEAYQEMSL